MSLYPLRARSDPDPMRHVRDARERGENVRLITGHDPDRETVIVAWLIPSTNQVVIEGHFQMNDPPTGGDADG